MEPILHSDTSVWLKWHLAKWFLLFCHPVGNVNVYVWCLFLRAAFLQGWTPSEGPATTGWSRGSTGTAIASTLPIADPSTSTDGRYPSKPKSLTVGDFEGWSVMWKWLPGGWSSLLLCVCACICVCFNCSLCLWCGFKRDDTYQCRQLFCSLRNRISHYANLKCDAETARFTYAQWTLTVGDSQRTLNAH